MLENGVGLTNGVTPWLNHTRMRDSEAVQVRDCISEDDLKELISTTYTNKMHLLFDTPLHKSSTIKCTWLGVIM